MIYSIDVFPHNIRAYYIQRRVIFFERTISAPTACNGVSRARPFVRVGDSELNLTDYEARPFGEGGGRGECMRKNGLHSIRPEYPPRCLYR